MSLCKYDISFMCFFLSCRSMDAENLKKSLSEMSINRYKRQIVDKISQVLVQLVAVLRNFSTDGGYALFTAICA